MQSFKNFINEDIRGAGAVLSVKPSSQEDRNIIHEPKIDDRKSANMMASFQHGENVKMNRNMRLGQKLSNSSVSPHVDINTALQNVIGRNSEKKGRAISHPGVFYHGQTHDPVPDKNGIITHKGFTSWSSDPGVAMQFVKHKGESKGNEVEAHHVFVMHHDPKNEVGHALFSLHSKEHSSAPRREEEAVGGPVRYKVTHSDYVGDHPKTGKPVFEYHVRPYESHPMWNSKSSGKLSKDEEDRVKSW